MTPPPNTTPAQGFQRETARTRMTEAVHPESRSPRPRPHTKKEGGQSSGESDGDTRESEHPGLRLFKLKVKEVL